MTAGHHNLIGLADPVLSVFYRKIRILRGGRHAVFTFN